MHIARIIIPRALYHHGAWPVNDQPVDGALYQQGAIVRTGMAANTHVNCNWPVASGLYRKIYRLKQIDRIAKVSQAWPQVDKQQVGFGGDARRAPSQTTASCDAHDMGTMRRRTASRRLIS